MMVDGLILAIIMVFHDVESMTNYGGCNQLTPLYD